MSQKCKGARGLPRAPLNIQNLVGLSELYADFATRFAAQGDESDDRFLDFYEARNIAQTLARAVIDLTAKVERVEALAETWEEAARLVEARGGDAETVRDLLQDIRDALNGENA